MDAGRDESQHDRRHRPGYFVFLNVMVRLQETALRSTSIRILRHVNLSSYGDLDPQEMPLLILNGFEYVTQVGNDPYAIPLRADTSKPKLTQQDDRSDRLSEQRSISADHGKRDEQS